MAWWKVMPYSQLNDKVTQLSRVYGSYYVKSLYMYIYTYIHIHRERCIIIHSLVEWVYNQPTRLCCFRQGQVSIKQYHAVAMLAHLMVHYGAFNIRMMLVSRQRTLDDFSYFLDSDKHHVVNRKYNAICLTVLQ